MFTYHLLKACCVLGVELRVGSPTEQIHIFSNILGEGS